jgi:hypothetical protein
MLLQQHNFLDLIGPILSLEINLLCVVICVVCILLQLVKMPSQIMMILKHANWDVLVKNHLAWIPFLR